MGRTVPRLRAIARPLPSKERAMSKKKDKKKDKKKKKGKKGKKGKKK